MTRTYSPQRMLRRWIIRGKLWLKQQCERLSTKQRKVLVYGISLVYLLCSLFMIAQFFVTPHATALPIPKNEHLDRPALLQQDTENQKKMPRFILNDENVTNSYGFKIKTEGIILKRFKANPVMLDGHNPTNLSVIGKWIEIKAENGKLSAETEFDLDDENAKVIAEKVERDIIKGASMGISFNKEDFTYENGELILKRCELLEVSIVAIPSNAEALKLMMNGEEITPTEMKNLCLSMSQNNKNIQIENSNTMKIRLSQLAFLALGFEAQTQEASQEQIDTAVLKLQQERDALKSQLALSEEKVNAYVAKEQEQRKALSMELVETAIAQGKITAEKKESFLLLANENFDLAKSTLEAIPAKQNFGAGVNVPAGTSAVATMEDFQKLSIEEQLAFKNSDPEAYKTLLKTI